MASRARSRSRPRGAPDVGALQHRAVALPIKAEHAQHEAKKTPGKTAQPGKAKGSLPVEAPPDRRTHNNREGRAPRQDAKPEIWRAAEEDNAASIRDTLGRTPAAMPKPVDAKYQGWTPLMKAAENGNLPILHLLLGARANVLEVNKKGRTALSFAAAPSNGKGNPPPQEAAYELLVRAGAGPELKDARGKSAP